MMFSGSNARTSRLDLAINFECYFFAQVGYAEKICNVWTKVAEDTKGHSGRFSEATPSCLSTPT